MNNDDLLLEVVHYLEDRAMRNAQDEDNVQYAQEFFDKAAALRALMDKAKELEEVITNTRFYLQNSGIERQISPHLIAQLDTGSPKPTPEQVKMSWAVLLTQD